MLGADIVLSDEMPIDQLHARKWVYGRELSV